MMNLLLDIKFDFSQCTQGNNPTILFVGIVIVFLALITLYFVFWTFPKLVSIDFRAIRRRRKEAADESEKLNSSEGISGEVNAAIAMALHMFLHEQHDEESYISTIKRVERRYSPWSSKIYNVRNIFNRY
jgi:Na+-transporting methylmalonyl-CoA/oxaloacetate decarboxylase gamma subunit